MNISDFLDHKLKSETYDYIIQDINGKDITKSLKSDDYEKLEVESVN